MKSFDISPEKLIGKGDKRDLPLIKGLALLIVVLTFLLVFLFDLFKFNMPAHYSSAEVKAGLKALGARKIPSVKTVQTRINRITANESEKAVQQKSSVYYIKKFKNSVILGDSITEGLTVYKFLSDEQVFCSIGASLEGSKKIFKKASKTYPKKAFFSFGMNDLIKYRGKVKPYIKEYRSKLKYFRKRTKDTEIYINSISKPSKGAMKRQKSLKHYKDYNEALEKMCKEEGYVYIDNSYILEKHKKFYAMDGIHVAPAYYPLWLNDMITEGEL